MLLFSDSSKKKALDYLLKNQRCINNLCGAHENFSILSIPPLTLQNNSLEVTLRFQQQSMKILTSVHAQIYL